MEQNEKSEHSQAFEIAKIISPDILTVYRKLYTIALNAGKSEITYRKAEKIELHNAGVVIHNYDYSDAITGWHEYDDTVDYCFVLNGECISELCAVLGIETQRIPPVYGAKYPRDIKDMELPIITKNRKEVAARYGRGGGSNHKVKDLEFATEKSDLIHIRFVSEPLEGEKWEGEVLSVTYSGRYTIWWKAD